MHNTYKIYATNTDLISEITKANSYLYNRSGSALIYYQTGSLTNLFLFSFTTTNIRLGL